MLLLLISVNILKVIKFLEDIRKSYKAGQSYLLVCCTARFILFKSVCLPAEFLVLITAKLHFVKLQNCHWNKKGMQFLVFLSLRVMQSIWTVDTLV